MALLRCLQWKEGLPDPHSSLTSACCTTFVVIAEVNMEVHAAQSAKEKRRPYQHYSASPKFGAQILSKNSKSQRGCSNALLPFQGA